VSASPPQDGWGSAWDAAAEPLLLVRDARPRVTNFIKRLMPFAAIFVSDPTGQDSTWLWHVFYDGVGWKPS